eukprot:g76223.t1
MSLIVVLTPYFCFLRVRISCGLVSSLSTDETNARPGTRNLLVREMRHIPVHDLLCLLAVWSGRGLPCLPSQPRLQTELVAAMGKKQTEVMEAELVDEENQPGEIDIWKPPEPKWYHPRGRDVYSVAAGAAAGLGAGFFYKLFVLKQW